MATAPLPVSQVAGGGDVGQVLTRTADEAGRGWATPEGLPPGGTAGQVLSRTADGYAWVTPASGGGGSGVTAWEQIGAAGTLTRTGTLNNYSGNFQTPISLQTGKTFSGYAEILFPIVLGFEHSEYYDVEDATTTANRGVIQYPVFLTGSYILIGATGIGSNSTARRVFVQYLSDTTWQWNPSGSSAFTYSYPYSGVWAR